MSEAELVRRVADLEAWVGRFETPAPLNKSAASTAAGR